jgi:hypothetical protein
VQAQIKLLYNRKKRSRAHQVAIFGIICLDFSNGNAFLPLLKNAVAVRLLLTKEGTAVICMAGWAAAWFLPQAALEHTDHCWQGNALFNSG